MSPDPSPATAHATFAGGCFWCTEAVFQPIEGVLEVVSGYTGGHVPNPTYEEVCQETTGHAEAVRITYDPQRISYDELLEIFFASHDPTTRNRQGNDIGSQYRSAIYAHDDEQADTARTTIARLTEEGLFDAPIVTEVEPAGVFYPAEAYHQDFYANNQSYGYCRVVINPKLAKVRQRFAHRLRSASQA
jgi:peptide-methionine (S)-S-oxide reductase